MASIFAAFRDSFGVGEFRMAVPGVFGAILAEQTGVKVPEELLAFWHECGYGRFLDGVLHVFGESTASSDSIIEWNARLFWREIFPPPSEGGPVFFAENAFGEQIGFAWRGDVCRAILAVIDSDEVFTMASPFGGLPEVLTSVSAVVDPARLAAVRARLGSLPVGMHFAPRVAPVLGGAGGPEDFRLESRVVHMASAVVAVRAARAAPRGKARLNIRLSE